jgi:hypothetical protein
LVDVLEGRHLPSIDLTGVGLWQERGPGPIVNGADSVSGSGLHNPVVGAVEALAPHLTNKNILYAGSVNGGVWKTTDAYDRDPVWTPLTDQFPSLSIGALAFSPMDASFNTVFAGIGATSNASLTGGPLTGILRTADGGTTWQQLGKDLKGLNVESVVPTKLGADAAHQVVLVAAHDWNGGAPADFGKAGIYRSTDGGLTFTLVAPGVATQLVADPRNANTFYAGVAGLGVFRSLDGGLTWTALRNGLGNVGDSGRIELAVTNDVSQNFVYAAVVGSDGNLSGVYRSTDQGGSWRVMGDSGFDDPNPPRSTEPERPERRVRRRRRDRRNLRRRGRHRQRVGRRLGPGYRDHRHPHPDSRDMIFDAAGQLLESDDGGIYRRVDRDHWDAVTSNLRVTEIVSIGYDALNDKLFAGTQDNARAEEIGTTSGQQVWDTWGSGDGQSVGVGYVTEDDVRKAVCYGIDNNLRNEGLHYQVYEAGNDQQVDEEAELDGLDSVDENFGEDGDPVDFPLAVNAVDGFGNRSPSTGATRRGRRPAPSRSPVTSSRAPSSRSAASTPTGTTAPTRPR